MSDTPTVTMVEELAKRKGWRVAYKGKDDHFIVVEVAGCRIKADIWSYASHDDEYATRLNNTFITSEAVPCSNPKTLDKLTALADKHVVHPIYGDRDGIFTKGKFSWARTLSDYQLASSLLEHGLKLRISFQRRYHQPYEDEIVNGVEAVEGAWEEAVLVTADD